MNEIILIAEKARVSISDYCMNTCKALCCKRGSLVLFNEEEVFRITGDDGKDYLKKKILTRNEETPNFYFNLTLGGCPHLDSASMCKIHLDEKRPRICKDYPLFIAKKFIILDENCPAVKANMLKEYSAEFEKVGYKVM